nr:coiled-coil alpha-helical rod protein 1 [Molossus molossus]
MLATLQQEGLLSRYKQQRLLAVLPSLSKGKSVQSSPRPAGSSASGPPAAALSPGKTIHGSLSVLLEDLQGLSEAISREEAASQGDDQSSPAPTAIEQPGARSTWELGRALGAQKDHGEVG